MIRAMIILVAIGCGAASAKEEVPSGTWKRDLGDTRVSFTFKKGEMKSKIETPGGTIHIEGEYGITKSGILYGIVTKVKKDGNEGPQAGDLFSFRFEKKGNSLKIKNLKTQNPEAGRIIEGDYKAASKDQRKN